jgi:hypothetical protein
MHINRILLAYCFKLIFDEIIMKQKLFIKIINYRQATHDTCGIALEVRLFCS